MLGALSYYIHLNMIRLLILCSSGLRDLVSASPPVALKYSVLSEIPQVESWDLL
jgi:hypothetical protein